MVSVYVVEPKKMFDWYAVDLHVHTPASKDYKGPINEEEYINILRGAVKGNIRVIAVSDHHSFQGYETLKRLRNDNELRINTLEEHSPTSKAIRQFHSISKLFSKVLFLPAVEIEVKPGVHMISIFDNTVDVNDLHYFLKRAGVTEDDHGRDGYPEGMQWDVLQLMKETSELGGITIAAHADTSKGIWDRLKGSYRANVFKNEHLYAICYNSTVTKDKIVNTLNQREYQRSVRLAFIQSSDHHGDTDVIGSRHAYLNLPKLNFHMIKYALRNPDERVSCPELPKIMQIFDRLLSAHGNVFIQYLESDVTKEKLVKSACAISNTADNTIVLGVSERKNLVGIPDYNKTLKTAIKLLKDKVAPIPTYKITVYPYGEKHIITIRINRGTAPLYSCSYDGHFYIQIGDEIRPGSSHEVTDIIEKHIIDGASGLLYTSKQRLQGIQSRIGSYVDGLEALRLARKIERNAIPLGEVFNYETSSCIDDIDELKVPIDLLEIDGNGTVHGDLIAIDALTGERPEEHYLRFSPPKKHSDRKLLRKYKITRFSGEKLILSPGGGWHYDTDDNIYIFCHGNNPTVVFNASSLVPYNLSLKFIVCWLKSSLALGYNILRFGKADTYDNETSLRLPLPTTIDSRIGRNICRAADKILDLEKKFLTEAEKNGVVLRTIDSKDKERKQVVEKMILNIETHNESVIPILRRIDKYLYQVYGLTDDEIDVISRALAQENLTDFTDTKKA